MIIESFYQARTLKLNGKHRLNIANGVYFVDCWFTDGVLNRTIGPAYYNRRWYVNGRDITEEVSKWRKQYGFKKLPLTKQQETLFKLRFL